MFGLKPVSVRLCSVVCATSLTLDVSKVGAAPNQTRLSVGVLVRQRTTTLPGVPSCRYGLRETNAPLLEPVSSRSKLMSELSRAA